MFEGNWNPYDVLIQVSEQLNHLTEAHNKLAHAFQQTEAEVNVLLKTIQAQQQTIISMGELFANKTLFDLNQMDKN